MAGDWVSYIHSRLANIEKQVFGAEQATYISETAPVYDALTEATTTAGPPPGTAPIGPPLGPAVPAPVQPVPDQSARIAELEAALTAAYALQDAGPPPVPATEPPPDADEATLRAELQARLDALTTPAADVPAGPAGTMADAPVNQ
jgi:hypothetical protein